MAHDRTQQKLPALNVMSKLALTRTSSGTLYCSGSCVTNFTDTCVSSESIVGCDASNDRKRDVLKELKALRLGGTVSVTRLQK